MKTKHFWLGASACAISLGCAGATDSEPSLTPAARTSPAAERAIEAAAAARCDHAQRCNSIGPTAEYLTREHCMNVMRADGFSELGVCGLGIRQEPLRRCLADVSAQSCAAPVAQLDGVVSCRSSELCVE